MITSSLKTNGNMEAEFPFIRGEVLEKMSRLSYYIKTKAMIALMDERIEELEHEIIIESQHPLKDKIKRKEDPAYQAKRHRLGLLQKQRERQMDRLTEMEVQIREDMDSTE